jgi:phage antirepressor YoqD-like protein
MKFVRRHVWEDLTPEQMVERYAAGASMGDLAMLAGIGPDRVRKILVAHGVTIRSAFGRRKPKQGDGT